MDVLAPHTLGRRGALAVLSGAQLMIALDATVMAVALPSVQDSLGIADADRSWIVTAYTLAFGALLLLGGRVVDRIGRGRALAVGLAGFAAASALAGLTTDLVSLALARGAQGASAALLAPAVLGLLAVTYTEPRERARAFAVFGAIAGGGGAVGLLLGGVLTETFGWRACLWVNLPIAAVLLLGARRLPDRAPAPGAPARLDGWGAGLVTAGLVAVVLAGSRAGTLGGWTVVLLGVGALLLVAFVVREARAPAPLLPLRLVADRTRVGALITMALAVAGMLGAYLLLTTVLQQGLGYGAIRTGLAFLPLPAAILLSAQVVAARLGARLAARTLVVPGLVVAAGSMALLTRLDPRSAYLTGVLPSELLLGLGVGVVFTPAISAATAGIPPRDAGVVAALVATAQQVGGSVGLAVLAAVAASVQRASTGATPALALIRGQAAAAGLATVFLLVAACAAAVLMTPTDRGTA